MIPKYFIIILLFIFCTASYSQKRVETGDIEFEFKTSESFEKAALLEILLLPKEKYFSQINLNDDLERLNKYYFDNGFFEALIDTSTSYDKDDEEMDVKFTIIENVRYTIREIKLDGLEKVSDAVRNEIYQNRLIYPGEPYIRAKVTQEKDRILNLLQNNGYYYAQVDTLRSRSDSSKTGIIIGKYSAELQKNPEYRNKVLVKLTFIGTEDIYTFGKTDINIIDNKYKIEDNVIEREMKFKKGDIYNKAKMLESERNFTKLEIIQLGRVLPDSVIESEKKVNVKVNITLNKKYELTPSIGATYQGNRFFAGASLEYKDKNFFGAGRVFSVNATGLVNSVHRYITSLSFSLFQPYLFRNNLTLTLTSSISQFSFDQTLEYILSQNLARFNYYIADFTFYNNAYADLTFDYIRLNIKSIKTKIHVVNSVWGITLSHNNTNNIFNPTKGFIHSITAESSGALPRFLLLFNKSLFFSSYFKLYNTNSFYFDASEGRGNNVLATHFEIGDIIEYGQNDNIVPVDRLYKFFMGGGNSLRGWGAQEGGILAEPKNGGKFIIEGSTEFRRKPFPPRSFLYPVWAVVFLDYGNVWESDKEFKFNQIALSTGFGIRYDTFVGPVRIDLGFKLFDPLAPEGEKWLWQKPSEIFKGKYAIQFGLGNAF